MPYKNELRTHYSYLLSRKGFFYLFKLTTFRDWIFCRFLDNTMVLLICFNIFINIILSQQYNTPKYIIYKDINLIF